MTNERERNICPNCYQDRNRTDEREKHLYLKDGYVTCTIVLFYNGEEKIVDIRKFSKDRKK